MLKDLILLKVLIVFFMLALMISLGAGFYYLMVDRGDRDKRRLFTSLGVRLALASGLILVIVYGVASGQLGHRNPWDAGTIEAEERAP